MKNNQTNKHIDNINYCTLSNSLRNLIGSFFIDKVPYLEVLDV